MSTPARHLVVTVPAGHALHSATAAASSASRLLQLRLDELCADLGVAPLHSTVHDGAAMALRLDAQPLRLRLRVAFEVSLPFEPRAGAAHPLPPELVKAETACRWIITNLLGQRERWAPPAHDAGRRDDGLDTLPLPPPRVDLLLADRAELGEAEASTVDACGVIAQTLYSQLGLTLPTPRLRIDPALASGQFRVRVAGVRLPPLFGPLADEWMVYAPMARLQDKLPPEWMGSARPFRQPWSGETHTLLPASAALRQRCDELGLVHGGPLFYRLMALAAEARWQAASLVSIDSVAFGLQGLARLEPALPAALLHRATGIGLHVLAAVCRGLVEEGVSIRDFSRVVHSLLAHRGVALAGGGIDRVAFTQADGGMIVAPLAAAGETAQGARLLAAARQGFEAAFTQRYAPAGAQMQAVLVHGEVERAALAGLRDDQLQRLRQTLKGLLDKLPATVAMPVLLTTTQVRRRLRDALRVEFPWLDVLSFSELAPQADLFSLGTLAFDPPPPELPAAPPPPPPPASTASPASPPPADLDQP